MFTHVKSGKFLHSHTMKMLAEFFERAKDFHILVVGDVMVDRYLKGYVERISPEAPVPVLHYESTESRLGGAANVALNIRRLGAKASIMGITGKDSARETLLEMLHEEGIESAMLTASEQTCTTVKTRVMAGHQHLLRVDEEKHRDTTHAEADEMRKLLEGFLSSVAVDAIILQDYNKGFLSAPMIRTVLDLSHARKIPVCVDPKEANFFEYEGATIFKPNLRELRAKVPFGVDVNLKSLSKASKYLAEDLKCEMSAITLSEHGIFLAHGGDSGLFPTRARTVVDVCGAGDAVIAVLAMAYLMQASLAQMAELANTAGGVVCSEVGVCPIDLVMMKRELG